MEGVLLSALGGRRISSSARPHMEMELLDARTLHLQLHALEKGTVNGYSTGARDYLNFCINHSLPIDPTPLTLSRYIAYTSQFIASGPKYLSGVRHFLRDIYPDYDASRKHPLVTSTIRGSIKLRADPVHRKLPLRLSHLATFLDIAEKSGDYDDLLFIVILSCAFYACHRSGELISKNEKSMHDWRKVIKRGTLVFTDNRAEYHLPYHKGDPFFRGTTILFTRQDIADPVQLLIDYATRRDAIHGARAALFLRANGTIPTRSWFDKKFFAVLDRTFGGHSPRAGGATFYAGLGVSPEIIQAVGRWSSAAWKIYIRDNPAIRVEQQLAQLRLLSRGIPPS